MIFNSSALFFKKNISTSPIPIKFFKLFSLLIHIFIFISLSCSPTKRFPVENDRDVNKEDENKVESAKDDESVSPEFTFSNLRVLLNGVVPTEPLLIESLVHLYSNETKILTINPGTRINCLENNGKLNLNTAEESFDGDVFFLIQTNDEEVVKLNGKSYRGKIQISKSGNSIDVINIVNLEDYVKGVLAKEMPIGKNEENLEALKALAICVRTYALQRVKDGKVYFDLYADTRDQVYGGADSETPASNKAAEQTKHLILKYENNPALVYYHSTCGGHTESSKNVFTKMDVPYLSGVKDGSEPYCKISPRFEWKEIYSEELIIERLKNYALLDNNNYTLVNVGVSNRYDSGRVNELEIEISDVEGNNKLIAVKGNEIRSILRTADGKNILWSNMFDVSMESDGIVLTGKGFGHGVGLCQWGAIALSRNGWSYKEILEHYYPGTSQGNYNDQN